MKWRDVTGQIWVWRVLRTLYHLRKCRFLNSFLYSSCCIQIYSFTVEPVYFWSLLTSTASAMMRTQTSQMQLCILKTLSAQFCVASWRWVTPVCVLPHRLPISLCTWSAPLRLRGCPDVSGEPLHLLAVTVNSACGAERGRSGLGGTVCSLGPEWPSTCPPNWHTEHFHWCYCEARQHTPPSEKKKESNPLFYIHKQNTLVLWFKYICEISISKQQHLVNLMIISCIF